MGSKADYLENKVLDHIFRQDFSAPSTLYIALFTAAPSDSGGGTEVSGNNYSRKAVSRGTGNWASPSGGATENSSRLEFATPSGSWGTITHFGIFDAASGGNLLYWGALSSSVTIGANQIPIFEAGDIDITED